VQAARGLEENKEFPSYYGGNSQRQVVNVFSTDF